MDNKVLEFFNFPTINKKLSWEKIVEKQHCGYINKKCLKIRKSEPGISIGTCSVSYGKDKKSIIICPHRMLEKQKIFFDCLHLLTTHEPGNELHVVSEISIPGGSVDYFLVSANDNKIEDFIGIEIQTLDTTGTVWPERQRFLDKNRLKVNKLDKKSKKTFGINWKMTAKTILVQLHHKIQTFENLNKHLVLVLQDCLLDYMENEFVFGHIKTPKIGDSMHFHSYKLLGSETPVIKLNKRISTNREGIAKCIGLKAEANIKIEELMKILENKISNETLLRFENS